MNDIVPGAPRKNRRRNRGSKRRRGAAIVEFALVLPPLTFLIFAIIDYGWIFMQACLVANAARDGARVEAMGGDGQGAAIEAMVSVGLPVDPSNPPPIDSFSDGVMATTIIYFPVTPLINMVPTPDQVVEQAVARMEDR